MEAPSEDGGQLIISICRVRGQGERAIILW